MKAIQITVDEELLRKVDATLEAKKEGRSAVFRRAAAEYLRRRQEEAINAAYRRGYGKFPVEGDDEMAGWAEAGAWPTD